MTSDRDLILKLAQEHLHSAFDPLPDTKLDFSIISNRKNLQEVTIGDVALMLKKAGKVPSSDQDKIDLLLGCDTAIPSAIKGMKEVRQLFNSLSLSVAFSDRFLDIFRGKLIIISIHLSYRDGGMANAKVVSLQNTLNQDW
jgi:hypothetical protein